MERRPALGRPALGKGLSALIPDAPAPAPRAGVLELAVTALTPNSHQPRLQMDDGRLEELANSIRANGIIQPILVRRHGDGYRIIAGERRWRAAQRAGLATVPVVVREMPAGSDQNVLELALIENIQRENLNPIDEALAYQRLAEEFGLTQEQIAAGVGKDRSTVANLMRLLRLPEDVRMAVASGALSMGHARALLTLTDAAAQSEAAKAIAAGGLSVREAEQLARDGGVQPAGQGAPAPGAAAGAAAKPTPDVHTRAAEDRMRFALGTKVRIARRGKGGTIVIDFTSEDELNRIYEHLIARS